jgi:iron-sulfur cluster insertion protein
MITITEKAKQRIGDVLIDSKTTFLRTFVQGGGCTGFQYGFTLEDAKGEDDFEFPIEIYDQKFTLLVDAVSMNYLTGSTIDYKEDLNGSQFSIKNPNSTATCGCGSSFAV